MICLKCTETSFHAKVRQASYQRVPRSVSLGCSAHVSSRVFQYAKACSVKRLIFNAFLAFSRWGSFPPGFPYSCVYDPSWSLCDISFLVMRLCRLTVATDSASTIHPSHRASRGTPGTTVANHWPPAWPARRCQPSFLPNTVQCMPSWRVWICARFRDDTTVHHKPVR